MTINVHLVKILATLAKLTSSYSHNVKKQINAQAKLIMQVTTKNGIQVKLKRNTIPEYADEFNRCSISNKMYKGEIMATSEKVALVYAEGREEEVIIAVNTNLIIVDCETIGQSNELLDDLDGLDSLDDFCEAMSAIRKRHNL